MMTHNVEKSSTCAKCEKKFLRKDNMLQQVKNYTKLMQILLQPILVMLTNCSIVIYS